MTTLQTVDGRYLRAQRPTGATLGGFMPASFPALWSDGEREPNSLTDSGVLTSFESIYRSQPVIAGAVDKLTRRLASLPFDGYRRDGNNGSREIVSGDTLDTLLKGPLPRYGKIHLLAHIFQSMFIHGNALVATLLGADRDAPPVMLWPLDWAQTSAYGEPGGQIEWWSTRQFDSTERFIRAEEVMHFAWPGPSGGQIGISPLEKLGVTVRLEDATQRHQTAMFRNGSRPSLAIALEQEKPSTEVLEYVRDRVEAMHRGQDNSGRTFFMGANVKVQPLSLTPVETALIEQRRVNREEVGMVYDLSGPLMNDLTHGTYANVEELNAAFYRDVLPPWISLVEQTFQRQLLDRQPAWPDRFVGFDLTDKLKGDPMVLSQALRLQVESGLITRNEARRILNLPPDGAPNDPANPANKLTANVNNQAPVAAMQTDAASTGSPPT